MLYLLMMKAMLGSRDGGGDVLASVVFGPHLVDVHASTVLFLLLFLLLIFSPTLVRLHVSPCPSQSLLSLVLQTVDFGCSDTMAFKGR